jgi:hypothetical protein
LEKPCIYKNVNVSGVIFVVLYVDDILLIGMTFLYSNKKKFGCPRIFP